MAKHDVNFRQGGPITGDSGERGNDPLWGPPAIKPTTDGERAVAANLDRPPENLRKRTEVLRGEMEGQKYLQDADMRWVLSSGKADGLHDPTTDWPLIIEWQEWGGDPLNRWYFKLEPNIAVVAQPLNTPSHDLQETKYWEFPTPTPANGVNIAMQRRAYSLANIREVVWETVSPPYTQIVGTHGTAQFLDLTLSGENDHILTITIRDDDATMLGHLSNAFLAWNIAYLAPAGFWGSITGAAGNAVRMSDIPLGDVDYIFEGTADRELHYITAETFWDFFNAGGPTFPNLMNDGDTLSVMWEYLVNPDPLFVDGRRQAIPSNPGTTEVAVPRLFLSSVHPEWIPLGIPLCKRIGKELLWLDGTVATEGMTVPIRFGENGYTVERIFSAPWTIPISMTSKWFDYGAPPTWATVLEALDGIVSDLAGTQDPTVAVDPNIGTNLLGLPEITMPTPSGIDVNTPAEPNQISLFQWVKNAIEALNEKGSLNRDEKVTGDPTGSRGWRIMDLLRFGEDSAEIRDMHATTGLRLVYRNNGIAPTDPIDFSTLSIYEGSTAAIPPIPSRVMVWGATIDSVGLITAAPAGGPGKVTLIAWSPGTVAVGTKVGVTAGYSWNVATTTEWDTLDVTTGQNRHICSQTQIHRATRFLSAVRYDAIDEETTVVAQDEVILEDLALSVDSHAGRERHRFVDGSSRVYKNNMVLEGLYPVGGGFTDPDQLRISPGAAIIGGREFILRTELIIPDAHNYLTPELNTYVLVSLSFQWAYPCFWVYVWLRKDGRIFLDHLGPSPLIGADAAGEMWTGDRWWSPRFDVGTYERSDFCLIGLTYIYKGIEDLGLGIWKPVMGTVVPVGGNAWRFRNDVYSAGPVRLVHVMDPIMLVPTAFNNPDDQWLYTDRGNNVDSELRTPGIPTAVTARGLVSYEIMATIVTTVPYIEYLEFNILHEVVSPWFHNNVSLTPLRQLEINTNSLEVYEYGDIFLPDPIELKFRYYSGGIPLEVTAIRSMADYGAKKRWRGRFHVEASVVPKGADPVSGMKSASGYLYLLGFEWERNPSQNQIIAAF